MSLQTTHAGGSFLGIPGRERTEMASMANSYYFASWLAGGRLCILATKGWLCTGRLTNGTDRNAHEDRTRP